MLRLAALSLVLLVGCTARNQIDYGRPSEAAVIEPILVATTRQFDPTTEERPVTPGRERSEQVNFARYDIAIPPGHTAGEIRRARRGQAPDPNRDFIVASSEVLDRAAFRQAISAEFARQPRSNREAVIFVHGFNTTFIEGVYRVAQLGHDLQLPGVLTHYSWPSMGAPLAYVHDRDSANFARDGLQQTISDLRAAGAQSILLIAHSMGSHVVTETLRQMSMDGSLRRSAISGVMLISPDIDVDVFRQQAHRIGRLPQPFIIMTSQRDRILNLSASLTGEEDRLGNLADPSRLEDLDVTLLDVTAFSSGTGHFAVGESPALIRLLNSADAIDSALSSDASGRLPLLPGAIITLQNTTDIILQPLSDSGTQRQFRLPWRLGSRSVAARAVEEVAAQD